MENIETMEYYVFQTQDIIYENCRNKTLTAKLSELFLEGQYKSIKIIASGSSCNGSWCAKYIMEKLLGIPVQVITPYTFTHYPQISEDDFIFVISQSGCSLNALDALDCLKKNNRVAIALTGDLTSDIKEHSDVLIEYGVGEEKEGYVTKGVTTLVQFLIAFAMDAAEKINNANVDRDDYVKYCKQYKQMQVENLSREEVFFEKFRKNLLSMQHCYTVGCGNAEGIAKEGALKIGETVKIVSCAYELEEYIHGPNLQLTPNHNVFIIDAQDETSERSYQIFQATRQVTDRAYYITDKEYEDDHVLTLLNPNSNYVALSYLQFFQLLANRFSKELRTIPKHPLMKEFNKLVNSKTTKPDD